MPHPLRRLKRKDLLYGRSFRNNTLFRPYETITPTFGVIFQTVIMLPKEVTSIETKAFTNTSYSTHYFYFEVAEQPSSWGTEWYYNSYYGSYTNDKSVGGNFSFAAQICFLTDRRGRRSLQEKSSVLKRSLFCVFYRREHGRGACCSKTCASGIDKRVRLGYNRFSPINPASAPTGSG